MTKILTLAILSLFFIIDFPFKVLAETVLERIERTGEINAGARKNAVPFGYENSQGQWTGYSVEFLKIIHRRLEQKLNKPIKLNLQEVTIDNRFKMVQNGRVDLVCDATSITQQRLDLVDFSVPFFMAGTQFLIDKQDINNIDIGGTLAKVPVAYIPNTTTDRLIRQVYPLANWQPVNNRQQGIEKLKKGEVSAVASDGVLLLGELVRQGGEMKDFILIPEIPMTSELYACILPKNEPRWKEFVDTSIAGKENHQLQEKWFELETESFPYIIKTLP
ncbi:amino acid ABC transporter substrate-binding protein [Candidatus Gracilibacteria bacterium]|nr:amino acid ABC transporter substrate-binding protein [Candidatus Gracilibacteria bacterium]NJM87571.1 amino acid ABC transporter substrate-binding protein [Hydrococcus sp. RU_2_2]